MKKGLTGYDACHAALARNFKGKWLTFDQKAHKCLRKEQVSHDLTKMMSRGGVVNSSNVAVLADN